ncbi:MAG: copper homeostasis protein CutC [Kiritimatiellae bacterium]|nr:copper homeostasis protein CutC [Kiritimatiellia bacterium]
MLEVCVDSVESAVAARAGGADRLELCAALVIGGISPTTALYGAVRRRVDLPIRAMVRPRFGDFLYTDAEKEIMLAEAREWCTLGVEGVVTGALTPDGRLDVPFLRDFAEAAGGLRRTLHRAFDLCADPFAALEDAIALGFDTILTSGQQSSCRKGAALIAALRRRAAERIEILVGAGVDAAAVRDLRPVTGCTAFHMSGKVTLESGMVFRREGVPMGLPGLDEYSVWRTDAERVRAAHTAVSAGLPFTSCTS